MTGIAAPAPEPPAALYPGMVTHARLKPVVHRFRYRVLSLLIDLDRLGEADRLSALFGVNRPALFAFHERDHGPRDGTSLRAHTARLAADAGIDLAGGRVRLLCYPRLLGYVFNPLSVYYCEDRSGRLVLLIYEVRNTFGEMHSYVRPVADGTGGGPLRQRQDKTFHVSPFLGMDLRYHFRMVPPAQAVKIRILETDATGPVLAATFHGRKRDLTTRHLFAAFFALPLVTVKIYGGILVEAARLWRKGVPFHPHPKSAARPLTEIVSPAPRRASRPRRKENFSDARDDRGHAE